MVNAALEVLHFIAKEVQAQQGIFVKPEDIIKLNRKPVPRGLTTFDSFAVQTPENAIYVQRFSDGNVKVQVVA